ncbi:hypothetical protein BASA81_003799 [Batrachochytrium salamandrivorans]|nr:hypothetical protein BASA81_003799 [Batrachochytrium salamandrivorans]
MQPSSSTSLPELSSSPLIASLPQTSASAQFKLPSSPSSPVATPEKSEPSGLFWSSPAILAPMFSLFSAAAATGSATPTSSEEDDEEDLESIPIDDAMAPIQMTTTTTSAAPTANEFDPILFIALLPSHAAALQANLHVARPLLPQLSPGKPTLVLDLDETLVHCNANSDGLPGTFDIAFEVKFNNVGCNVFVRKRPHLDHFLLEVSKRFEVVIFTASQRVYADNLLNLLDPTGERIHHRLFRESCALVSGNLVKDLTVLGRDLKRTMIVDNCPHAFGYHMDNGIPILSWYEDKNDCELLKLLALLEDLHELEDVRPVISQTFGMRALVDEMKLQLKTY